jgi:hypothetical protein
MAANRHFSRPVRNAVSRESIRPGGESISVGPLLADSLEGAGPSAPGNDVDLRLARGCDGAQPSRSPPILVGATDWTLAGRFPGGRPVPRRREMMLTYGWPAAATERSPPGPHLRGDG